MTRATTHNNEVATDIVPATRLARLDGLRGIAACTVAFAYHPQILFKSGLFAHYGPVVNWLHVRGWSFVDVFFLISGYIFGHVYLRASLDGAPFDLVGFAMARFARLYPLHLLLLVIVACASHDAANTPLAFVFHLFMMQAFINPVGHSFDGPSWSLSVECVCYGLFAWALSIGPRALNWLTGLAVGWAVLQIACFSGPDGPWPADVFPRAVLGFFLGQILWRQRQIAACIATPLLVALATAGLFANVGRWSPLLPMCLFGWPAALLLVLRLPVLESRPLLWLGDRSYAIYLIHLPLIDAILAWAKPISGSILMVGAIHAGIIGTVLVLADIAYRGIEQPGRQAIRARWARRERRSQPSQATAITSHGR